MAVREIIFRGKDSIHKDWVYGSLIKREYLETDGNSENLGKFVSYYCIITKYENDWTSREREVWVDENTIGQYTGRKDKNGTKIFEGDIVKKNVNGKELKGLVEYKDCAFGVRTNNDGSGLFLCFFNECEVIGNIHDNPELLEGVYE